MVYENDNNYTGRTFKKPIHVNGKVLKTDNVITINREPYYLEKHEFDKIRKDESFLSIVSRTLCGGAIILFINLHAKFIGSHFSETIKIDEWELYAFGITSLLLVIIWPINYYLPNERKEILNRVNKHYEDY